MASCAIQRITIQYSDGGVPFRFINALVANFEVLAARVGATGTASMATEGAPAAEEESACAHVCRIRVGLPTQVRSGQVIPYTTFGLMLAANSTIQSAGTGLFADEQFPQFTWIGLYPGKVTARHNGKREDHTMGSIEGMYIIAEEEVKTGVHMANEATAPHAANVWYLKLDNGYCLYFAGEVVDRGAELLTCYSRSYGKRRYQVPRRCSDPRCAGAKHRIHSDIKSAPTEWLAALASSTPVSISDDFLKAAGLVDAHSRASARGNRYT